MTEYNVDPTSKKGLFSSINFKPTLEEVLKTAKTGDVITLSPGTYNLEEEIMLKPNFGNDNSAVVNDSAYIEAYLKTGRKEEYIPTEALIIRGASNNADDVHLLGNVSIDNSAIIFENITFENKNDVPAITGDNNSEITFINCILTEAQGQDCTILLGKDRDTLITFSYSYIAEKDNSANIYFLGAISLYNTDLRSGLILRKDAIVSANKSNLNWIEAYDESYVGIVQSKFDGAYYYATDSAKIEFYASAIELGEEAVFAKAEKNAKLLGKDIHFEGSEHIPTVKLSDNATAEFNIVNQNDFFAGKQVKVITGNNDENTIDESESIDTDSTELMNDTTNNIPDDVELEDTNDINNENKVIVNNNQELVQVLQHSTAGTVIVLKSGNYYYDGNIEAFNSITLEGENLGNTTLTFNTKVQVQEGCILTFNNLRIFEDKNYDDASLLVANQNNSKIVLNDCVVVNRNHDTPLICAQMSGANVELNNVSFIDVYNGIDVTASDGGKAKVEDSYATYVFAIDGGSASISTSNVAAVIISNNCNVDIRNSVIEVGINAMNQSNITLTHVTMDSVNPEGMFIKASGNSQIKFYRSVFHNERGKINCTLADQSSIFLDLWEYCYSEDNPVNVKCTNPDKQVDNPEGWTLNFEN